MTTQQLLPMLYDYDTRIMARTENKGSAEVREWEIYENSTRYDHLLAAPSDEQLTKYWSAWVGISLFGGLFVAFILLPFVLSKKVRSRSFNLYLVYLMIPDAVYSILCGIVCMLHAINKSQVAELCNFQMLFIVWGVGSNMWLNAAVTHQLYNMLRDSDIRRKYKIPTTKFVTRQALVIYIFTVFLGTWGFIEAQEFPHYVASTSGLACLPVEQSWQSSIFFWLVFFPAFGGIPITYVLYISFLIWKHKLLPPQGKRRLLVIYFGRIVVVFILCWVPYMLLLFAFTSWMPTWVHFAGGTLSHLQGAISAALSLLKPDLYHAVKSFYTCQKCRRKGGDNEPTESSSNSWLLNFNAVSRHTASVFRSSNITGKRQGQKSSSFCQMASSRSSNAGEDTGPRGSVASDDSIPPDAAGEFESSNVENGGVAAVDSPENSDARTDNDGDDFWPDRNGEYSNASTASTTDHQCISNDDDAVIKCSTNE